MARNGKRIPGGAERIAGREAADRNQAAGQDDRAEGGSEKPRRIDERLLAFGSDTGEYGHEGGLDHDE